MCVCKARPESQERNARQGAKAMQCCAAGVCGVRGGQPVSASSCSRPLQCAALVGASCALLCPLVPSVPPVVPGGARLVPSALFTMVHAKESAAQAASSGSVRHSFDNAFARATPDSSLPSLDLGPELTFCNFFRTRAVLALLACWHLWPGKTSSADACRSAMSCIGKIPSAR